MQNKPVALDTGANKGIGLQIAKDLASHGLIVLVGSRNLERGEAAAPGFTATDLNNFEGNRTVTEAAREPVRPALLGDDGPTGTFSNEDGPLPW